MKSGIRVILVTAAILVVGVVGVSASDATGPNTGRPSEGAGVSPAADAASAPQQRSGDVDRRTKHVRQGLEGLGLSKVQLREVAKITQEFRTAAAPLASDAQALTKERMKLINRGTATDRNRIAEIDVQMGSIRKRVIEARSRLQARLTTIFTPEQRVLFQRMMEESAGGKRPAGKHF